MKIMTVATTMNLLGSMARCRNAHPRRRHRHGWGSGLVALALIMVPTSCSLAVNVAHQPEERVFELFYADFRSVYAYAREYTDNPDDCSLDELYRTYRPLVSNGMGALALAKIFYRIEDACNDPHFRFTFFPYQILDQARQELRDAQLVRPERDPDSTHYSNEYVQGPLLNYIDFSIEERRTNFRYGLVRTDITAHNTRIGYILVENLVNNLSGAGRLDGNRSWIARIDDIVQDLNAHNVESIIIDVRTGAGGSHDNGRYIASRFIDSASSGPYIRFAQKTAVNRFADYSPILSPLGNHAFRAGRMILLTGHVTCSGGEMFALAMRKRSNLVHVGYNESEPSIIETAGCAGAILQKDLANGWLATFTSSQSYCLENDPCAAPDGRGQMNNYFRRGIQPDFHVRSTGWQERCAMPGDPNCFALADTYSDLGLLNAVRLLEDSALFTQVYDQIPRYQ